MNATRNLPAVARQAFDLFRIEKSKEEVDLSPQTIRAYIRNGLACYRKGKCVFVSRSDLIGFLEKRGDTVPALLRENAASFEMFPLPKGKDVVDIAANTLRKFVDDGLPVYKRGKTPFVSKSDLATFIRGGKLQAA